MLRRTLVAAPIVAVVMLATLVQLWVARAGDEAAVATRGTLFGSARVATSADITLAGTFPTRPDRTVLLQRRNESGDWVQVRQGTTQHDGRFGFDLTASSHTGFVVYRAVAPGPGDDDVRTDRWRVEVAKPGSWAHVSPGWVYSCGVKTDHTAWCWGRGEFGQLGIGPTGDAPAPRRVRGKWRTISTSGIRTTCGIRRDSSGWCWGTHPGNGQSSSDVPVRLDGKWRTLTPTSYSEFSGGPVSYTCGIRTNDSLWCWGDNFGGVLGVGVTGHEAVLTPRRVPGSWREVSNPSPDAEPLIAYQCGIRTDGSGWCWGGNFFGSLGDGTTENRSSPVQVAGTWASLTPSLAGHTCGLRTDATAWCWGDNSGGQVGDGTTDRRLTPYQLPGTWRELDLGDATVCGIGTDDSGWCWGQDHGGAWGGDFGARTTPFRLDGTWKQILTHGPTCGVQTNGSGWCWGDGSTPSYLPHHLDGSWSSIEPGRTTCGVRVNGTGWCWGSNYAGQVGNATFEDQPVPSRLPGRWSVIEGDGTLCGIRPDDTAACWGSNRRGQAGAGIKGDISVPSVLP